jgi:hypothetical protein
MSVDVCGFLEISVFEGEELMEDYAWMSCLDIGNLGLCFGDECRILFGESKDTLAHRTVPNKWPPIAKRRGLPSNMGRLTAQAVGDAVVNELTTNARAYTFVGYDELAQLDWQAYPDAVLDVDKVYGWGLLLSLMRAFDKAGYRQRLVVWFFWY